MWQVPGNPDNTNCSTNLSQQNMACRLCQLCGRQTIGRALGICNLAAAALILFCGFVCSWVRVWQLCDAARQNMTLLPGVQNCTIGNHCVLSPVPHMQCPFPYCQCSLDRRMHGIDAVHTPVHFCLSFAIGAGPPDLHPLAHCVPLLGGLNMFGLLPHHRIYANTITSGMQARLWEVASNWLA